MNPSLPAGVDVLDLPALALTPEAFAPFGTVLAPIEDGVAFGEGDARLDLSRGVPRFYTMRLGRRDRLVRTITRHRQVTQALAAVGGLSWLIAVAPPRDVDQDDAQPELSAIRAFRVPGDTAIALHRGTWHAGPLFDEPQAAFFNLELSDTNVVDHHSCLLIERYRVALRLTG